MNNSYLIGIVLVATLTSCCLDHRHEAKETKVKTYDRQTVQSSDQVIYDAAITTKVKAALMKEKFYGTNVNVMNLHVKTINGVVYLTGTADSKKHLLNSVRIANQVNGVKYVDISKVVIIKR